jgi:protein-arginine kinase activator protein McsA
MGWGLTGCAFSAIKQDLTRIKDRQKLKLYTHIGNALHDEDDLIRYYRRIEAHFRQLQVSKYIDD